MRSLIPVFRSTTTRHPIPHPSFSRNLQPSRTFLTVKRTFLTTNHAFLSTGHTFLPTTRTILVLQSTQQSRSIHSTSRLLDLENMFDPDQAPSLTISRLTQRGYELSDDLVIPGGVVFIDSQPFLWNVDPPRSDPEAKTLEKVWEGWGKERFGVFEVVTPRPEILLFGTGSRTFPVPKEIKEYISSLGIQLDVMDSRNAASTYNMLLEEGRRVAAALCPLVAVDPKSGKKR
ncbi:hypothetical protein BCR39DRAFT_514906 [Naematelia encephala]|uniref:NADH dehydrogenase [ubiquinone] 1 alpha subcomplex assembly factor 3 n=1 Tax=Naematelia encephala TaxID=71784 RepID=A0A1Y2BJ57_9TREE|nr:hypothetical protein BCR39DRAFT_514906 [Naematelia encephala]